MKEATENKDIKYAVEGFLFPDTYDIDRSYGAKQIMQIMVDNFDHRLNSEMRERAMALNPATADTLIATFHSMCVRILRRDADHIGYNRNFTIVDPGEQRTLMKRILKKSESRP